MVRSVSCVALLLGGGRAGKESEKESDLHPTSPENYVVVRSEDAYPTFGS